MHELLHFVLANVCVALLEHLWLPAVDRIVAARVDSSLCARFVVGILLQRGSRFGFGIVVFVVEADRCQISIFVWANNKISLDSNY